MLCNVCGTSNPDEAYFCENCGEQLRGLHRISRPHHAFQEHVKTKKKTAPRRHWTLGPIDRLLQWKQHDQVERIDHNIRRTTPQYPAFSDTANSAANAYLPDSYHGGTQGVMNFNEALKEVRRIRNRWELIAFAGQVRICGDPDEHSYVAFLPYRQVLRDKKLDRLVSKMIRHRDGALLVHAKWILGPVVWGDVQIAERMYRRQIGHVVY